MARTKIDGTHDYNYFLNHISISSPTQIFLLNHNSCRKTTTPMAKILVQQVMCALIEKNIKF